MSTHMTRALRRRLDDAGARDEGSTAIELVGIVFMLVVVTCLLVQGLVIAQAGAATQKAARDGARALALGRDANSATRAELPDWAQVERISSSGGESARVEVEIRVPIVLPGITSRSFTVTRNAEMPRDN